MILFESRIPFRIAYPVSRLAMPLIAVPITVDAPDEVAGALFSAEDARAAGAQLVEWRIDRLVMTGEPNDIIRLVSTSPLPCIVTCRAASEGGGFDGEESLRLGMVEAIAGIDEPPRYIDVEWSAIEREPAWREVLTSAIASGNEHRDRPIGIIISTHDFDGRPADLTQRLEAMNAEPLADVVKVAWRARSLRDNLEAFELLEHRQRPTIMLCMGEFGLMSRVLAPKHGGMLTFAALRGGLESAPGQPSVAELRDVYRFGSVDSDTAVYGVIGWPVGHSRGPIIHNAGFAAVGHGGVYLPLPVPSEYEHFKATVGSLIDDPRLNFRGASVTLPHKAHLVRFVEERGGAVGSTAVRLRAANTLVVDDDDLSCFNSDAPAAAAALSTGLGGKDLAGMRALVIGAGGVARAVIAGLHDVGVEICVTNRTRSRAEAMLAEIGVSDAVEMKAADRFAGDAFDIIVNATSVGMVGGPSPDESPLPAGVVLREGVAVFDTVYTPALTPLLRAAREAGAITIGGLEMFLMQAAMQFESWTRRTAPLEVFRAALGERGGST